jgi:hypothetical protein
VSMPPSSRMLPSLPLSDFSSSVSPASLIGSPPEVRVPHR